ncbi:MAG: hypothetical protein R6U19_01485 [Bacteroidales bacterium]
MKKLLVVLTLGVFLFACNNESAKDKEEAKEGSEVSALTTEELLASADEHVEEEVVVKGSMVHACAHGGERMFIKSEGSDERLKVTCGEGVPSFKQEDEGSTFLVTGILKEKRIDEEYLDNWEKEVKEELSEEHHVHDGKHCDEETHKDEEEPAELARIESMRQEIKESEKDYLSDFSLEATSYEKK